MGPTTLLRRADHVTPEWLTEALAGAGQLADGAKVVSFEAAPIGTGQMADTTRFVLTYDEPGGGPRQRGGQVRLGRRPEPRHRPRSASV